MLGVQDVSGALENRDDLVHHAFGAGFYDDREQSAKQLNLCRQWVAPACSVPVELALGARIDRGSSRIHSGRYRV